MRLGDIIVGELPRRTPSDLVGNPIIETWTNKPGDLPENPFYCGETSYDDAMKKVLHDHLGERNLQRARDRALKQPGVWKLESR